MNEIQRYLAEEIALDCGQGQISRPEALRRLRVMGVGAAVAAALLSACGSDDDAGAADRAVQSNTAVPADGNGAAASPDNPTGTPTPTTSAGEMPAAESPNTPTSEGNVIPMGSAMTDEPAATPPDPAAISTPDMALPTEAITFAGPRGQLQAAWSSAVAPRGAVLVIHENRGLNDHIRNVAGRFAAAVSPRSLSTYCRRKEAPPRSVTRPMPPPRWATRRRSVLSKT